MEYLPKKRNKFKCKRANDNNNLNNKSFIFEDIVEILSKKYRAANNSEQVLIADRFKLCFSNDFLLDTVLI